MPGNPEEQDSYREELGGVMGMAMAIKLICTCHGVTRGSVEMGLDGEATLVVLVGPAVVADRADIDKADLQVSGSGASGHQGCTGDAKCCLHESSADHVSLLCFVWSPLMGVSSVHAVPR